METIEKMADFSVERIKEIENITHHDLIAFTTSVAEFVGPDPGISIGVSPQRMLWIPPEACN